MWKLQGFINNQGEEKQEVVWDILNGPCSSSFLMLGTCCMAQNNLRWGLCVVSQWRKVWGIKHLYFRLRVGWDFISSAVLTCWARLDHSLWYGDCPVQYRVFSSITGLYPPKALLLVATQNVPRYRQMSLGGQSHPC